MKRYLAILLSLLLICGLAFAEEAEDPDAITSATLHMERLPEVKTGSSSSISPRTIRRGPRPMPSRQASTRRCLRSSRRNPTRKTT